MSKPTAIIIGAGSAGLLLNRSIREYFDCTLVDIKPAKFPEYACIALAQDAVQFIEHKCGASLVGADITELKVKRDGGFGGLHLSGENFGVARLGRNVKMSSLNEVLSQGLQINYMGPSELIESNNSWHYGEVSADFVFVTTGVVKPFAKQLGAHVMDVPYNQSAYIVPVKSKEKCAWQWFEKNATWAYLPTTYGGQVIATGKITQEQFISTLDNAFGKRFDFAPLADVTTVNLVERTTTPQSGKSWGLFGASAHHFSPIAAQGFNLTVRDIMHFEQLLKEFGTAAVPNYAQTVLANQQQVLGLTKLLARKSTRRLANVALDSALNLLPLSALAPMAGVR